MLLHEHTIWNSYLCAEFCAVHIPEVESAAQTIRSSRARNPWVSMQSIWWSGNEPLSLSLSPICLHCLSLALASVIPPAQEPGSPEEIFDFAYNKKRVAFDMFRKVEVNGPSKHPLFAWLLGVQGDCVDADASCAQWAASGECERNQAFMLQSCKHSCHACVQSDAQQPIRWNFESFLISRDGNLQVRWPTGTDLTSDEAIEEIENLLTAKGEL